MSDETRTESGTADCTPAVTVAYNRDALAQAVRDLAAEDICTGCLGNGRVAGLEHCPSCGGSGLSPGAANRRLCALEAEVASLRERASTLQSALVDIRTLLGDTSINNGTSTLGLFIDMVLKAAAVNALHDAIRGKGE